MTLRIDVSVGLLQFAMLGLSSSLGCSRVGMDVLGLTRCPEFRGLAFSFSKPKHGSCRSATQAVPLPQPEPRAMREHFIVPSIGRRDVARAEWPDIRRFEHLLDLLNIVDDAFDVHAPPII